MRRAALLTAALTGLFFIYVVFVAPPLGTLLAPLWPEGEVLLNMVAVPLAFGAVAYLGSRAVPWQWVWLIALPVLIPLPTLLYLGGDPAKPGLENVIYVALVIIIALAEAGTWLIDHLVVRRRHVNVEA